MASLTNLASNKQTVNVRSTFRSMSRHSSNPCISRIIRDIERKVNNNTEKTIKGIGEEVGTLAKISQHAGLAHYDALFYRKLFNSIQYKQMVASRNYVKYEIGTSLNESYPYILIKGRKSVQARNTKFLRFKLTPNGEFVFRKKVKGARKRDYMSYADKHTKPAINSLVGRYIRELFR